MTRPEIAQALNCLITKCKPCAGCPFNPRPGTMWPYGCISGERGIVEIAQAILRESETEESEYERKSAYV